MRIQFRRIELAYSVLIISHVVHMQRKRLGSLSLPCARNVQYHGTRTRVYPGFSENLLAAARITKKRNHRCALRSVPVAATGGTVAPTHAGRSRWHHTVRVSTLASPSSLSLSLSPPTWRKARSHPRAAHAQPGSALAVRRSPPVGGRSHVSRVARLRPTLPRCS
jgi:hypothetical protein